MNYLFSAFILVFSVSATAVEYDQTYTGKYVFGPEVDSFELCDNSANHWVSFGWAGMDMHTFYNKNKIEPYQEMYLSFRGHLLDEQLDGFAKEYDGLIRISEVKEYSFTFPTSCNKTVTDDSYSNVRIGDSPKVALQKLTGYISTIEQYDNELCYYLIPENDEAGALFMIANGVVARIDVYDEVPIIKTYTGLGIGSTKLDILSKYKNVEISPHPYTGPEGEYLEVKLQNGNGLIFETENDIVTSFRLGSYPAVQFIEGCS